METPIADFLREYEHSGFSRFHMPGHKGNHVIGCESWDITEIRGGDSLYEADGIIARSEENATALFGAGRTVYSTEGSSQCIRAMLYLALNHRGKGTSKTVVAARNVHKSFVYAAALLDFEVVWLWPEENRSVCDCAVNPEQLEKVLSQLSAPPAAVYVTSPNYLGAVADVAALAEVAHRHETLLLVDNAHGAYLHFLPDPVHPLDLGADLCCDSAHKTLPVLTGGAYLHISKRVVEMMGVHAKQAMALFGSTSPSYLIMASLDLCNHRLEWDYPVELEQTAKRLEVLRERLVCQGWQVEQTDPMRVTIVMPEGISGIELSKKLWREKIECEYADPEFVVFMVTPGNREEELEHLADVLGENTAPTAEKKSLPLAKGEQVCSVREALFASHETIAVKDALGRICGAPTVACPPAIPIAVSGERIGPEALALFEHYGVTMADVLK